jgi:DNA gyrase/topoisomerase IV subunit B
MNAKKLSFEEAVRKRPGMYIGAAPNGIGITHLLKHLILNIYNHSKSKLFCRFSILGKNKFQLEIRSDGDIRSFLSTLNYERKTLQNINRHEGFLFYLSILSSALNIEDISASHIILTWEMDSAIFTDTAIDFNYLSDTLLPIAALNRDIQILIADHTQAYLNQVYYAYPQGLRYLFERYITEHAPMYTFKLSLNESIGTNHYQIHLAYRRDWYPSPKIESFIDNYHAASSNEFVNGILQGFISGVREVAKNSGHQEYKIEKNKFYNGLILLCSVHRDDYHYAEISKGYDEGEDVKEEISKVVENLTLGFFDRHDDIAEEFLSRFYNGDDRVKKTIGDMYR